MTSLTQALQVRGEELLLHADRAVLWPRLRTVIVADTHFGKSGYFGRHGIAIPAGTDEADRARLQRLLSDSRASRLVILGDFLHSPSIEGSEDSERLKAWVAAVGSRVEMHVVAGNHDRGGIWTPPEALHWWSESWRDPPFRFVHEAPTPPSGDPDAPFTLSGHLHPVVRLRNGPKSTMRVPILWQRPAGLVLPSFGSFTGGFAVRAVAGDRLFAVAPGSSVVPLEGLGAVRGA